MEVEMERDREREREREREGVRLSVFVALRSLPRRRPMLVVCVLGMQFNMIFLVLVYTHTSISGLSNHDHIIA